MSNKTEAEIEAEIKAFRDSRKNRIGDQKKTDGIKSKKESDSQVLTDEKNVGKKGNRESNKKAKNKAVKEGKNNTTGKSEAIQEVEARRKQNQKTRNRKTSAANRPQPRI